MSYRCLYCNNEAVRVSVRSTFGAQVGGSINIPKIFQAGFRISVEATTIQAPKVFSCDICGRTYMLIASADFNEAIIEKIFKEIEFDDKKAILQDMKNFDIDPEDMINNIVAIVIPLSIGNKIRKFLSSRIRGLVYEIHIIFESEGGRYYLSAYRNNRSGKTIGKKIEKIW